jgi:hypothetical protein
MSRGCSLTLVRTPKVSVQQEEQPQQRIVNLIS